MWLPTVNWSTWWRAGTTRQGVGDGLEDSEIVMVAARDPLQGYPPRAPPARHASTAPTTPTAALPEPSISARAKRNRRALRISLARLSLAFSQRSPLLRRRNRAKARAPCLEESTRHLAPSRHRWHVDEHRRWLVAVCRQGGVRVSFDLWSPLGLISGVRHHGLGLNCRARLCEACSMTSALNVHSGRGSEPGLHV